MYYDNMIFHINFTLLSKWIKAMVGKLRLVGWRDVFVNKDLLEHSLACSFTQRFCLLL